MKFKIIPNQSTPKVEEYKLFTQLIAEDRKMLEKFLSFSRRQRNCVGLAANQVSLNGERIMERFFTIKINHTWKIIIDPIISERIGREIKLKETCLTWLGKTILANRHYEIRAKYYNLNGDLVNRIIKSREAQIFQHEYDHLMGVEEVFV
jgi:peptide deformylase